MRQAHAQEAQLERSVRDFSSVSQVTERPRCALELCTALAHRSPVGARSLSPAHLKLPKRLGQAAWRPRSRTSLAPGRLQRSGSGSGSWDVPGKAVHRRLRSFFLFKSFEILNMCFLLQKSVFMVFVCLGPTTGSRPARVRGGELARPQNLWQAKAFGGPRSSNLRSCSS